MKLEPEKFYAIKLAAMATELNKQQLEAAQLQASMARVMFENSSLKQQLLQPMFKAAEQQLSHLAEGLKEYGATLEDIDWDTGEIKSGNP